jgi:hypothetical protein
MMQSGCTPAGSRHAAPANFPAPRSDADSGGAKAYDIVPERSELHILVYRGGPLARLGHNHVVSSKNIAGAVWMAEPFERSGFKIILPVESLIVDDPDARRAEGDQFPPEVPADAREGTHRNLLKPEVLDGGHYPAIVLRSVSVAGSREAPAVVVAITIKDATREIPVKATVHYEHEALIASGEFDIKQTDFGIAPFSIGLGALQVQDALHLKFKLVATHEISVDRP